MNDMNIESAKYLYDRKGNIHGIHIIVDGKQMGVPLSDGNRHYVEIMRQVNEGTLTIQEAQ